MTGGITDFINQAANVMRKNNASSATAQQVEIIATTARLNRQILGDYDVVELADAMTRQGQSKKSAGQQKLAEEK